MRVVPANRTATAATGEAMKVVSALALLLPALASAAWTPDERKRMWDECYKQTTDSREVPLSVEVRTRNYCNCVVAEVERLCPVRATLWKTCLTNDAQRTAIEKHCEGLAPKVR
jgi:hypothetical protein